MSTRRGGIVWKDSVWSCNSSKKSGTVPVLATATWRRCTGTSERHCCNETETPVGGPVDSVACAPHAMTLISVETAANLQIRPIAGKARTPKRSREVTDN
ncbi:hypothetical protein GCM10010160_46470 [Acrocarpospora corrugata]